MAEQRSFADLAWSTKGKVTRRERFLAEMDAVIPWDRLKGLIEPHYAKPGQGRPPLGLERMLRIYFLQQWFDLSDPAAEDALYDSESMRRFARIDLGEDVVPDESTILRFRHLLEAHELTKAIFAEVRSLLREKRLLLRQGTIVDATIIAASSSTKNAAHSRDPEMRSGRKNDTWHFGMKVHIGTDKRGVVHSLTVTDAAEADVNQLAHLVHGEESELYGDRAYWDESDRRSFTEVGVRYRVNRRAVRNKPLTRQWRQFNQSRSRVRARCEHPFRVVKDQWHFRRTRYRGLLKNRARAYAAFALANLYLVRRKLMPQGAECRL